MLEKFELIKETFMKNIALNIIDILLFAVFLYLIFSFLKKNNARRLIKYMVLALVIIVIIVNLNAEMPLMSRLFVYFFVVSAVIIILLFPQQIRRALWKISSPKELQETYNKKYNCSDEELHIAINEIVHAALSMAKKDVGALIVVVPEQLSMHILESGTKLDAVLSSSLLESIFNTKAPLHDGAVVIRGNRVVAAGCFLPLTQSLAIDKELGTRHRAAIGVTETNDVLTIIVSEETGVISIAYRGELKRYLDHMMLTDILEQIYGLRASVMGAGAKKRRKKMVKK